MKGPKVYQHCTDANVKILHTSNSNLDVLDHLMIN